MRVPRSESDLGLARGLTPLLLLAAAEKIFLLHVDAGWLPSWTDWFRGMPLFFGLTLAFFGREQLKQLQFDFQRLSYKAATVHVISVGLYIGLAHYLRSHPAEYGHRRHTAVAIVCTALIPLALVSLVATFLRVRGVVPAARNLGIAWVYAGLSTAVLTPVRELARSSWNVTDSPLSLFLQHACFSQTSALLHLIYHDVYVDSAIHVLGTTKFVVLVGALCSGIEGLSLVLLLTVAWLIFERRELQMRRALLLIPAALALSWTLNVLRLTVLIMIGSAGHPQAAMRGFHEQAGWIALNIATLAGLWFVQRSRWFHKPTHVVARARTDTGHNFPAIFIAPFAAILAASMVTQSMSAGFERFYPLRLLAVLFALWFFRTEYRKIDWQFGLLGPLAGLAVGGLWVGLYLVRLRYGIGPELPSATYVSPHQHLLWIIARVAAAIVTVPIAEELAFRGFLARRIVGEHFEAVPYRALSLTAIAVSSVAFGLMHGHMWAAGTVAGVVFALVARARNRLGEAVAAHAVANLVVAGLVLVRGDYSLW